MNDAFQGKTIKNIRKRLNFDLIRKTNTKKGESRQSKILLYAKSGE